VVGIETSHAILLLSGRYVLQLRDDKPTIPAPGVWSLFGGAQQKGETSLQAVRREIFEELSIKPARFIYLWHNNYYDEFHQGTVRINFFAAEVDAVWSGHRLTEGQAVGVYNYSDLVSLSIPAVIREAITRFHDSKCEARAGIAPDGQPDR
jgi:8-oxo-dGTP pyrophosphatase MutT (NUDIX family)